MKKPSKPGYKKAPKMPKAGASTQSWDNFNKKIEEIKKHNDKLSAEYNKQMKMYETEMKRREKIKAKAKSGLGAIK